MVVRLGVSGNTLAHFLTPGIQIQPFGRKIETNGRHCRHRHAGIAI